MRLNPTDYRKCRLPIALLQISAVGTTRWGQTLCVEIFVLALAGLFSGVHFMLEGASLRSDRVRLLWLEVNDRVYILVGAFNTRISILGLPITRRTTVG